MFIFFVITLFFEIKVIYMAFITYALLYFAGGRLLGYALENLKVESTTPKSYLFPGETGEVQITMENSTFMPLPWLTGQMNMPVQLSAGKLLKWVMSLPPRSKSRVKLPISGLERGLYKVGPLRLTAGDSFALHQQEVTVEFSHQIIIYPRISPLQDLGLPSRIPFGNQQAMHKIYPDPSRLAGVRPYEKGDPLRYVHWRATARTGDLQVKQFEHTLMLDTHILLNMNEAEYSVHSYSVDSELAVETAASLANYLDEGKHTFGITASNGWQLLPKGGTSQLMQVLEGLATIRLEPSREFSHMLRQEAKSFAWGATLLVVTPHDTQDIIEACLSLKNSGYQVLLFITGPKVLNPQFLAAKNDGPLKIYHVNRNTTLELGKEA